MLTTPAPPTTPTRAKLPWVWLWCALATAVVDIAFHTPLTPELDIGASVHLPWMAPLMNLLVFGLAALPFVRWRAGVVFTQALLLVFTLVLYLDELFNIPVGFFPYLVLSAGIAVNLARLYLARSAQVTTFFRRSLPVLAGLILLGNVPVAWSMLRPAPAAARAQAGAPNVVLIVLDTVRAKSLELYGNPRATMPRLTALAREGVVFERAIAPTPWTLPSHATLFTGQYPPALGFRGRNRVIDPTYPTLAGELSKRGYATAAVVGNPYMSVARYGFPRGFQHFDTCATLVTPEALLRSSKVLRRLLLAQPFKRVVHLAYPYFRPRASEVNAQAQRWLASRPLGPYFLFINYYDAHWEYFPAGPERAAVTDRVYHDVVNMAFWRRYTPEQLSEPYRGYEGCLRSLDRELGELIDGLKARGELSNTVLIITADHGEAFGEHGLCVHQNALYGPLVHVPLLIIAPGVPAGRRVAPVAGLRDIPATVCDLAGIDGHPFPGRSLAAYWGTKPFTTEPIFSAVEQVKWPRNPAHIPNARGPVRAVWLDGYQCIRTAGCDRELYDAFRDPESLHNLASDPGFTAVLHKCGAALDAFDPRSRTAQP